RLAEPQDIRGLARKYPDVAFAAGICLVSLAGLPITGGFFARVMLLTSAAGTGALLAMLLLIPPMIVLSATYLSMLLAIAFTGRPAPHEHVVLPGVRGALRRAGITAIVTAIVILGVLPHLPAEPLRVLLR
ncbi:MAG: proton-conducting transporter membrane subunit, partial [Planctomycetota bacterium]